jgi:hypothetical protein
MPSDHVELNAEEITAAKIWLIRFAQKGMETELKDAVENGQGRYRKLAPVADQDGIYRVGSRLFRSLLMASYQFCLLLIIASHCSSWRKRTILVTQEWMVL